MVVDKKRIIGKMKGRGEGEAPHKKSKKVNLCIHKFTKKKSTFIKQRSI
jgi:hypothetical protein